MEYKWESWKELWDFVQKETEFTEEEEVVLYTCLGKVAGEDFMADRRSYMDRLRKKKEVE